MADEASFESLAQAATSLAGRRAWPEAHAAWVKLKTQYPDRAEGYRGQAHALKQMSRLAEADTVLDEGMKRVPGDLDLAAECAWLATELKSEIHASQRWDQVVARFPDEPIGYIGLANLLRLNARIRVADIVLLGATLQFPDSERLAIDYASIAVTAERLDDALARWLDAVARFPASTTALFGAVTTYRALGRREEGDALAIQGRALFPDAPDIAAIQPGVFPKLRPPGAPFRELDGHVAAATEVKDWLDVIDAWEHRPADAVPSEDTFLRVAVAYREAANPDAGDRTLGAGIAALPQSLRLAVERGWFAIRRGRPADAIPHFERVLDRFGKESVGVVGYAAALRDMKRFELADLVLLGGRKRFPGNTRIAGDYIRCAQATGRRDEAMQRCLDVIEALPDAYVGYRIAAEILRNDGRLDDAADMIDRGLAVAPKSVELRSFHAWLATYRHAWDEAGRRWQYLQDNYPTNPDLARDIALGLGEVRMGRGLKAIDAGAGPRPEPAADPSTADSPAPALSAAPDDPDAALFSRWESLGDDCEFGLVQRHFGLEPISLTRWTSTKIDQLRLAFEQDFEGVGALDNTQIVNRNGEYVCWDNCFDLRMHTFIRVSVEDEAKVLATMANRMTFLRRKLLEDLEDGDRAFVFKARTVPDDATVRALHAAMQRHGPNRLLVVVEAATPDLAGTLRTLAPGAAIGHIAAFGNRHGGWDINFKAWSALCTEAEKTLRAA